MLRDLRISGFRGLREFAMSGLGRVNLLVGTNNCGKTSVLEAIHMLSVPGSSVPLWQVQNRRGELVESTDRQIDIAHITYGHKVTAGRGFHIMGTGTDGYHKLSAAFRTPDVTFKDLDDDDAEDDVDGAPTSLEPLMLQLEWREGPSLDAVNLPVLTLQLPITRHGGLEDRRMVAFREASAPETRRPVLFITTEGLTRDSAVSMFDRVVLTPAETTV